jgi:hypothetical protein
MLWARAAHTRCVWYVWGPHNGCGERAHTYTGNGERRSARSCHAASIRAACRTIDLAARCASLQRPSARARVHGLGVAGMTLARACEGHLGRSKSLPQPAQTHHMQQVGTAFSMIQGRTARQVGCQGAGRWRHAAHRPDTPCRRRWRITRRCPPRRKRSS